MPDFSNSRLLAMVTPQTDWASTLDFAKYERAEGLPAGLLTAVMRAESGGDPSATSQKGAGGLFQLMPKTASYYDVDPYDPLQAVEGATAELGALYRKYNKDLPKTLAAWNWGQGNLDQQGFASAPAETQGFVQRVTGFLGPRSAEAAPPQAPRTYSNDELLKMITPVAPQPEPDAQPSTAAPSPPAAPATPLAPAFGLQGEALAPDTPSGPRLPGLAMSGDVIEDMSSGAVTRARMPSDLVVPIEKPSTPQPPLPGTQDDSQAQVAALRPATGVDKDRLMREAFGDAPTSHGWREAAATGINMVGGAGGAAVGGAVGGLAGPAGVLPGGIAGEALGSLAARKLNVALGLEEPGTLGDVLSVAVPFGSRAAVPAVKGVMRNLPGASRVGHELAEETLERLSGRLAPATASETLFAQAAQHNPAIPTTSLSKTASTIVAHEQGLQASFRQPRLMRAAQDLEALSTQYGGQIPLQELDEYRKRLGLMIGQASAENWPHLGGLKRLYASLTHDLEQAAASGVAGAETLREAIGAARQEFATRDLAHLWGPGRGMTTLEGGQTQVHGKRILNQFDKMVAEDPLFAGSFPPGHVREIRETLQQVADMTARSPTSQGPIGSVLRRVGLGAGVGTGIASGDPVTGLLVGASLEAAPYVIAAALRTAPGRAMVRRAFQEGGGVLTPAGLALISQAIRGEGPALPGMGQERQESPQGAPPLPGMTFDIDPRRLQP